MRARRRTTSQEQQRAFPLDLTICVVIVSIWSTKIHFATGLSAKRTPLPLLLLPPPANQGQTDRRSAMSLLIAPSLLPAVAHAGIDVSSLKVEANLLDVFLGGTYFEDSNDDRDGVDGRISRRKYTIVETTRTTKNNKKDNFFETLEKRQVKILSESTAISSSRDDALELRGDLFLCKEHGGCIAIDFTPMGGNVAKGYWDAAEKSIRFEESSRVWSKQ